LPHFPSGFVLPAQETEHFLYGRLAIAILGHLLVFVAVNDVVNERYKCGGIAAVPAMRNACLAVLFRATREKIVLRQLGQFLNGYALNGRLILCFGESEIGAPSQKNRMRRGGLRFPTVSSRSAAYEPVQVQVFPLLFSRG